MVLLWTPPKMQLTCLGLEEIPVVCFDHFPQINIWLGYGLVTGDRPSFDTSDVGAFFNMFREEGLYGAVGEFLDEFLGVVKQDECACKSCPVAFFRYHSCDCQIRLAFSSGRFLFSLLERRHGKQSSPCDQNKNANPIGSLYAEWNDQFFDLIKDRKFVVLYVFGDSGKFFGTKFCDSWIHEFPSIQLLLLDLALLVPLPGVIVLAVIWNI